MTDIKRVSTYSQLFNKVLGKRLKYVNNIAVIVSLGLSIMMTLFYGNFWLNILLMVIRAPLIFASLFGIKYLRSQTITVDYSACKTLGSQIYYSVISKKYLATNGVYLVSSLIFGTIFIFQLSLLTNYYKISKEYEQRPKLNDSFVFYWFHTIFISVIYSLHQLIFQRDRLVFTYGVSKVEPRTALKSNLGSLIRNSLLLTFGVLISSPIVYYFIRTFIYRVNWLLIVLIGLDTKIPPYSIGFQNWLDLGYLSFWTFFGWESLNHIFNVYATIGCLDGKKPISTYSADPINTLLSGLRNNDPENQLSKLCAYQELAYIATLQGPEGAKLRMGIYNAHSKGGFIWTSILEECYLLIKETTMRINYRSSSDLVQLKSQTVEVKEDFNKSNDDIFGNSFISQAKKSETTIKSYDELINKTTTTPAPKTNNYLQKIQTYIVNSLNQLHSTKPNNSVLVKIQPLFKSLLSMYHTYKTHFLATSIGMLFRITLKRDTETRVMNAVNYGNAVIAVSNLLVRGITEDKNWTITNNHISETLNVLETPIRGCNNYMESLPPSVFLTVNQKKNNIVNGNHLIKLLRDLTLNEFKRICIDYNHKLNDLLLSARAFKLAKRVIDEEIANRA